MASRGRGARGTNALIERMAQILETLAHNQGGEPAEYRGLSAFTRHDPPKFEGGFDPEGAQRWLANIEKIFHAMGCWEKHKDLKKQKVREFFELKQGSMTVGEYAARFQELMKYWPHYQYEDEEEDLCAQFKHGLSKSRIFEANSKGKIVETRGASPMRQERRTPRFSKGPYLGSSNSQSRGTSSQEKSSMSDLGLDSFRGLIKCFRCGGPHIVRDYPQSRTTCSNCRKLEHTANVCWAAKRSESASIAQRPELRGSTGSSMAPKLSIPGRVFAMNEAEAS
ncbi:uncharacterized protein LOC113874252 [Abrus precatorius]|uniref:Uncharacterized protein LOC113874252 n=1 Tax=Abrus precatorius TaxID=3816 RepID=A0A8B8MI82_ABRPR|nr:uncharacterized protein LOC113874252 [Abrus precatorius]